MPNENDLSGKVGLDTTAFKTGVTELVAQMKSVETSFRASAAVMGNWSNSTQGLSERVTSLESKLKLQKQALSTLNSEYQKAVAEQGADSKSAQSLANQMFDMEKKISSTEGQLKKYQSALQTVQKDEKENTSSVSKLSKSFQDFSSQSKAASEKVQGHFSGIKTALSGLGGVMAGFVASMGTTFTLKGFIDSATAAEQTTAQMNAVLTSTKGIAGMTAQQLTDLAASQAKVTTYSAGTTKQAENMLLTFTNIHSNVFPQTIKATEDMATAMHMNATDAAKTLGKALNDPAAGLSKLTKQGVTFTDAQKKQIKAMQDAGNTAGAQKLILQELEKEFGGSAVAAGSTFSGQMQIAQNTLKGVGTTIGTALMPAIKTILPQLVKWGQNIADTVTTHKADIQNSVKNIADGIQNFFSFVSTNGGTIKGVIAGIAAAFAAWKIAGMVGTAVSAIKNMKTALEGAKTAQAALSIAMSGNAIGLVVIAIGVLVAAFIALWNNCEGFRNFWIGLWAGIQSAAQAVGAWFSGPFVQFFQSAGNGIKSFFAGIPAWFTNLWNGITSGIKTAWAAITTFFLTTWTNIGNGIKTAWTNFWTTINNLCNTIKTGIINIWNAVIAWFQALPATLMTIGSNMFTSMRNGVNSTINNVVSAIKTGIGAAIDWIKALPSEALQWGKDIIMGIVDGIKSAASAVGDAVKGVAKDIRKFLHFSVPDEGPLADFESWMPDFMGGLAKGIESSKYKVAAAIRGLSSDMSIGVKAQIIPAYAVGCSAPTPVMAGATYNFQQTIIAPKSPSPAETARQTRNVIKQAVLLSRK